MFAGYGLIFTMFTGYIQIIFSMFMFAHSLYLQVMIWNTHSIHYVFTCKHSEYIVAHSN